MDEACESLLDNPFWHAMVGLQRELAYGDGLARRSRLVPVAALERPDEVAFADLAELSAPGDAFYVLMRPSPTLPEGWVRAATIEFEQYVCQDLAPYPAVEATCLGQDDMPDMLELVELTRPGPLFQGSMALGRFLGIRESGRLVAMAGERWHLPGFREIATVCTHPAWREWGLASALTGRLASDILASGETPFLHVVTGNEAAARLYRRLGFTLRARLELIQLRRTES